MPDSSVIRTLNIEDRDEAVILFGTRDAFLRLLRDAFAVKATYRNPDLRVEGTLEGVEQFDRALQQVRAVARKRGKLEERDVTNVVEVIRGGTGRGTSPLATTEVGRNLRTRTDGQGRYVQALQNHDAVICVGPAGSGKTYLAVAWAVSRCSNTKKVRKIVLVRPAVEAGERLGFLPGDLVAKISPYLRPLYDALADMMEPDTVKKYMESEVIEILPLAYMRGRTLSHACIILDEGQNATRRADEDVPDAHGDRVAGDRDRRPDANRPPAHRAERAGRRGPAAEGRGGAVDRVPGSGRHRAEPAGHAHREGLRGRVHAGPQVERVNGAT